MSKKETSINLLEQFLPPGTFPLIAPFLKTHSIHLSLTNERKSVLGDYRHPVPDKPYHRISINADLNKYSFLITLLHEIAHLLTFVAYKGKVSPHGKEWKTEFRNILVPFLGKSIFPPDVEKALLAYIHNPAASTCTDPRLYKALYRYDTREPGWLLVDDLPLHAQFETKEKRLFEKIEQLRTRSKCRELKTGKLYIFPGIAEVKQVTKK